MLRPITFALSIPLFAVWTAVSTSHSPAMDGYSEDVAPSFCIGHHETNWLVSVTPQLVRQVHESNVCRPLIC